MFTSLGARASKLKKLTPEQTAIKRRKVWVSIIKKEIPRAHKQKLSNRKEVLSSLKKVLLLRFLYFPQGINITGDSLMSKICKYKTCENYIIKLTFEGIVKLA